MCVVDVERAGPGVCPRAPGARCEKQNQKAEGRRRTNLRVFIFSTRAETRRGAPRPRPAAAKNYNPLSSTLTACAYDPCDIAALTPPSGFEGFLSMICVLTRSCRNLTSPATASRQLYCSFSHICLRSGSCEKEPPSIIHSRQIDLSSEYTASGSTKAPRKPSVPRSSLALVRRSPCTCAQSIVRMGCVAMAS